MSDEYTAQEKKVMLSLARSVIRGKLFRTHQPEPTISDHLKEKRACFVTLTINRSLRGCIGHILPVQEVWKDIQENAVSSAFYDPRFSPLTKDEFDLIRIEISILTIPKQFSYESPDKLVGFLRRYKPGVILQKGYNEATFLPKVHDDIPNPEIFLSELCMKAGMESDAWKHPGVTIKTYAAEIIEESGKV